MHVDGTRPKSLQPQISARLYGPESIPVRTHPFDLDGCWFGARRRAACQLPHRSEVRRQDPPTPGTNAAAGQRLPLGSIQEWSPLVPICDGARRQARVGLPGPCRVGGFERVTAPGRRARPDRSGPCRTSQCGGTGAGEPKHRFVPAAKANALAERLRVQFERACLDEAGFADATLASKAMSLSFLSARDAGLYPQQAIDLALIGFARATGKDVFALETAEEQAQALAGGPESLEREIERLENGAARAQLIKLASAWAAGDLATIEAYFSWCDCDPDGSERGRLLGDRNAVLAERIASAYESRPGVFAAIGVLHMIGPDSVLVRLRSLGYSVLELTPAAAKR